MTNAVRVGEADNVVTAISPLEPGDTVELDDGGSVEVRESVAFGHKVALTALEPGDDVVKYDLTVGSATTAIQPGEHVHVHNVESNYGRGDRE